MSCVKCLEYGEDYAGEYDMLFNASKSKSILSAVQNLVIILIDIVLRLTLSYVAVLLRWLTVGHMLVMSVAKTVMTNVT